MELTIPSFLIAVQITMRRSALGTVTSTLQFSCSMGGVLGDSVVGVVRAMRLAASLLAAGVGVAQ